MNRYRLSLRLFILGSLAIVAVGLGLSLLLEQAWLEHLSVLLRQSFRLLAGAVAALSIIAWAAVLLFRRMQEGDNTEVKFQTLLECVPDALVIMDREGRIVLVNRRTEQMFGYESGELLRKPAETLIRKPVRNKQGESLTSFSITSA